MPIFFQQDINAATKLGIWEIREEEHFFLRNVLPQRNVSHPHKKLQHLAGRYLLPFLFPRFPVELIKLADTRKPFLEDEAYHFSISHCGNYAAAIVSRHNRVGVDIELITEKVAKVQHKFLTEEEIALLNHTSLTRLEQLTLLWSCKEVVFKWYGEGEIDFKDHITVKAIQPISSEDAVVQIRFKKEEPLDLSLHCHLFDGMVLSYVVT